MSVNVDDIPAVSSISRSSCKRQDEVDTNYPGVMQAVMNLVQAGVGQARNTVKYDSPSFAGELLLLAGMSLLAAADDNLCRKSCIDYKNLVIGGEVLPVQTIFVAMQDDTTPVVETERSPVKSLNTTSGIPNKTDFEQSDYQEVGDQSLFQSVPIDEETEEAMEEAAERRQQARYADKPSAASDGASLPKRLLKGKMRIPRKTPGITAGRD